MGYVFEIGWRADRPVPPIPVPQAGPPPPHETAVEHAGVVYLSEDRAIEAMTQGQRSRRSGGSRSPAPASTATSRPSGAGQSWHRTSGRLQALKLRGEFHAA